MSAKYRIFTIFICVPKVQQNNEKVSIFSGTFQTTRKPSDLPQTEQLYGFSPVCLILCFTNFRGKLNDFPHSSHVNTFSAAWFFLCSFKLLKLLNPKLREFESEWSLTGWNKLQLKILPQGHPRPQSPGQTQGGGTWACEGETSPRIDSWPTRGESAGTGAPPVALGRCSFWPRPPGCFQNPSRTVPAPERGLAGKRHMPEWQLGLLIQGSLSRPTSTTSVTQVRFFSRVNNKVALDVSRGSKPVTPLWEPLWMSQ